MAHRDDDVYLLHIRDAAAKIEEYLQGVGHDEFCKNSLMQDGVVRQIAIIGEAAKRLSKEMREKHADVPWGSMVGMRNKLIHDYMGVDCESVWKTAKQDVPLLKEKVVAILDSLEREMKEKH
jgi:uncharacterized protein with HEPN domain